MDSNAKKSAYNQPTISELQAPKASKARVINMATLSYADLCSAPRPNTYPPPVTHSAQVQAAAAVQEAQQPQTNTLRTTQLLQAAWYQMMKSLMQPPVLSMTRKNDQDLQAQQEGAMKWNDRQVSQSTGNPHRQTSRRCNTANAVFIPSYSEEERNLFRCNQGISPLPKALGFITSQPHLAVESCQSVSLPKPQCHIGNGAPVQGGDSKPPQTKKDTIKSQNHLTPLDGTNSSSTEDNLKKWLSSFDLRAPFANSSQGEIMWQPKASIKLPDVSMVYPNENPPEDPLDSPVESDPKEPVIRPVSLDSSVYDSKKERDTAEALMQLRETNVTGKSFQRKAAHSPLIRPKKADGDTIEALSPLHFATTYVTDPLVELKSVIPAKKKEADFDFQADLEEFWHTVVKALEDLKRRRDSLKLYIDTTFETLSQKLEQQAGKDGRNKADIQKKSQAAKTKSSEASRIASQMIFDDLRSDIAGNQGHPFAPVEEELTEETKKRKRSCKGGGKQNKKQRTMEKRVTKSESMVNGKRRTSIAVGIKKNGGGTQKVLPNKVRCPHCVKQKFYNRKYLPKHIANVHSQNKKKRKATKNRVKHQVAQTSKARKTMSLNLAQQMLICAKKLNLPQEFGISSENAMNL